MKILIACATCHSYKYLGYHADAPGGTRVKIIRETWKKLIPEGIDFKFFYGRGEGKPKDDEIFLDEADEFFAMPKKVRGICKYAAEHNYDFMFECVDDVFMNVPLILKSDFADYDYTGNALNLGNSNVPFRFCSGFAVGYSRKAIEIVANAEVGWTNFDTEFDLQKYQQSDNVGKIKWHDDLWIGSVLSKSGITPHNDERFIIEIWSDIGNGPPSMYPLDNALAVHVSPHVDFMYKLYEMCKIRGQAAI